MRENSRENARHASLTRLDKGTRARLAARPGSRDRLRASGFIRLALGGCVLEYFIRVYLSAPHIRTPLDPHRSRVSSATSPSVQSPQDHNIEILWAM